MPLLELIPSADNYSMTQLSASDLRTKLAGGLDDVRANFLGVVNVANIEWIVTASQLTYFVEFYNEWKRNPNWFDAFLVGYVRYEDYPWSIYKCQFVKDSVNVQNQSGSRFRVSAQLICYFDTNQDPTSLPYSSHSGGMLEATIVLNSANTIGYMPHIDTVDTFVSMSAQLKTVYQSYNRYVAEYVAQISNNPTITSGTIRSVLTSYSYYAPEYVAQVTNNPVILSGTIGVYLKSYLRYAPEYIMQVTNNPTILSGTLA